MSVGTVLGYLIRFGSELWVLWLIWHNSHWAVAFAITMITLRNEIADVVEELNTQ